MPLILMAAEGFQIQGAASGEDALAMISPLARQFEFWASTKTGQQPKQAS